MWTSPCRIAPLHLDDDLDQIRRRPFGARFRSLFWRKQQAILPLHDRAVKIQECRWPERDRRATEPAWLNPKRTESCDEAIQGSQIRRRWRERLRINNWCLARTDSATTARTPPGRRTRKTVVTTWTRRIVRSRMPDFSVLKRFRFQRNLELAMNTCSIHTPSRFCRTAAPSGRR